MRAADESVRRRWLIVFSGFSMFLVVGAWVLYINFTVEPLNQKEAASAAESEPGFIAIMSSGFQIVAREARLAAQALAGFVGKKAATANLITVTRSEINFLPENLEKIPKTSLP